ncbi:unnamed protein product [Closterium sp. NIES-65]|nr:unnamed protein product [Closterium sp. NIES-65]
MELSEVPVIPGNSTEESGAARPSASSAAAPSSPPLPSAKGVVASLVRTFEVHTQHHHQHLAFQPGSHEPGDGDEPVQERHRRRESRCHESEDQPLPKRAKLGDVDKDSAERSAAGTSSPAHAADKGPRLTSPRTADTDALAINPRSFDDEPALRGRGDGASVASDGLCVCANGANGAIGASGASGANGANSVVGAFRDAAADDASAAGGIDELWRKAELRAVTAEVAESEARVKALKAERDAREARVARASERCRQAEVSIQQATSAVHVAWHAQYSLRAAEWAAAVGVREGVAGAEEGRRRLNQLLMLAGSESGRGGNETKSITLGGMLMLEGSEAAAGTRDGLLHGKQQQEAICGAEEQGEQGGAEGRGERGAEGVGRLEGRPLDTLHALKALQTTAKDLSAASFAVSDRGVDLGAVEEHVLSINKKWLSYLKMQRSVSNENAVD